MRAKKHDLAKFKTDLDALDSGFFGRQFIMDEVGGIAKYYCLVISNFNPVEAQEIYENCTIDELRRAMLAYGFYHTAEE